MTKQNHKTGFLVAVMVFCAILLRLLGKFDILIVPGGIVRSLIYIALYIGWGISVSKRIIQVQVRHYLISVSCLMVFWFVIRSTNYFLQPMPKSNGIYGTCTTCRCCLSRCFLCL